MPILLRIFKGILGVFAGLLLLLTAALAQAPDRPLVFVPGIIGSTLADANDKIVWGNLASLKGSNFHKLNLLPNDGAPVDIHPVDALRDFPLLFGPIEVGLYSGLIDFLVGKQSLRDKFSNRTIKGNYTEGDNLFVFYYDWRRSNFANALRLDKFITDNIPTGEYDLIAHSMGGIMTRIMLSQQGPDPLCTDASSNKADLPEADYQALCAAIYGPAPGGSYPSAHLNAHRDSADRMHTFIEMAVPHLGSVNLASTLLEGWGKISERLLGGQKAIQNTVLSMAAPVELLPTYKNCCARGKAELAGQGINQPLIEIDEAYWMELLLGFGVEPCPYDRCAVRSALFRNGISNRRIIDGIMKTGVPDTLTANQAIVGRMVKNTRQTIYVDFAAIGNGDGVSYTINAEGDGTVHRVSAKLPDSDKQPHVVMHSSHPFIIGDEGSTNFVFNTLVDPVTDEIEGVSTDPLQFAGGVIDQIGVELTSAVLTPGDTTEIALFLNQNKDAPFRSVLLEQEQIRISALGYDDGAQTVSLGVLSLDQTRSLMRRGALTYAAADIGFDTPGIYTISLLDNNDTKLAQTNVYVVEE